MGSDNPNSNADAATFTSDVTTLNTSFNLSDPHFMHQENFALALPAHIGHLLRTSTLSSTEGSWMSKSLPLSSELRTWETHRGEAYVRICAKTLSKMSGMQ